MRVAALLLIPLLAGCTYGAPAAGAGSGAPAGGTTTTAATTTIDVSLTAATTTATPYGNAGGFAPVVTNVALGSMVRFVNVDSFAHTASSLNGTSFPASSPLGASALNVAGATLSGGWTSGTLGAGTGSQTLLADKAGTYLYGCFFHYGSPMRGAIVVK
ncbi:MAG: Copper binding protein plastocyanin/azurin family [Candidatus Eremiobacteraeota bacterium]|nr:Copper binding protein plastocyanin/azurin family [Candidatus Eremiobacteraeota bacterium]